MSLPPLKNGAWEERKQELIEAVVVTVIAALIVNYFLK